MEPINELLASCGDIKIKKSFLSKKMVYGSAEKPMMKYELFLDDADTTCLSKDIANNCLKSMANAHRLTNGQNKVEVYATADGDFAALRIYRFVPYCYEPRTDWMFFNGCECCSPLMKLLAK